MTKSQKKYNLPKYIAVAIVLHFLFAVIALAFKTSPNSDSHRIWENDALVLLKLPPPLEGEGISVSMMGEESADKDTSGTAPETQDNEQGQGIAKPVEEPQGTAPSETPVPSEIQEMMAEEKIKLEEELRTLKAQGSDPVPQKAPQGYSNTPRQSTGLGSKGAERQLEMEGFSPEITNQIMNRYDMRIETKRMKGSTQNFLSSASGSSGTYFTGSEVPDGIYEVWQLSRKAVSKMAHLEEEAIKAKGMNPEKTRVKKIVYGIVRTSDGGHDLGVTYFDAEPID